MKKSDICVVGVIYAICIFFFAMTIKLKSAAQTYPMFVLALLFILNTMYVVKMVVMAKKEGVSSGFGEVFAGFQPKQFAFVVGMIAVYIAAVFFIGFYPATVVFMVVTLLYLRVPVWQTAITVAAVMLLVYLAFSLFLKVRLPVGLLFK